MPTKKNIWRRFWLQRNRAFLESWHITSRSFFVSMSLTVAIIVLIFIFNVLLAISIGITNSLETIRDNIAIEIDIQDNGDFLKLTELSRRLSGISGVKVKIFTKEENLEKFLSKHEYLREFIKDNNTNPLSGTLLVTSQDLSSYDHILAIMEDITYTDVLQLKETQFYTDQKSQIQKVVNVAESIKSFLQILSLFFITLFAIIFLNAQVLSLKNFAKEIRIKKLIGAHMDFIREPFLWSGTFLAIVGVSFGFGLFWLFLQYFLSDYHIFSPEVIATREHILNFFQDNVAWVLELEIGIFVLLAVICSFLATSFYLYTHRSQI